MSDDSMDLRLSVGAQLLSLLEDPFSTFPIESVAGQLSKLVEETDLRRSGRAGPWGVSPAFHSVEDEHDIDVSSLLTGSVFVLAQGAIEQSVSIINRLGQIDDRAGWFPRSKAEVLAFEGRVHDRTGISDVAVVNAVANYAKHRYEWPSDWTYPSGSQRVTVQTVRKLGMSPGGGAANLDLAVRELGATSHDLVPIAKLVIEWRARMASRIRREWGLPASEW